jgi:hypothetical protein
MPGQSFDPHQQRVRRRLVAMTSMGDMGHDCYKLELFAGKSNRLQGYPIRDYKHALGIQEILESCKQLTEDDIAGQEPYKTVRYELRAYFGESVVPSQFVHWTLQKEIEEGDDDPSYAGGNPRDFNVAALKHHEVMFKQLATANDASQNRVRAELDSAYETIREQQDRIANLLNERTGWIIKEQQMLNEENDRKIAKDKAMAESKANQELFEFGKQAGMLLLMHTISGDPKKLPAPQIDYQSKLLGLKTLADGLSDDEIRAALPHMTMEQGLFIQKCNLAAKAAKGEEQKDEQGKVIPSPLPTLEEINAFWDSMIDDPERARNIMGGLHVLKQGYFGTMMQQRALSRPRKPQLHAVKD